MGRGAYPSPKIAAASRQRFVGPPARACPGLDPGGGLRRPLPRLRLLDLRISHFACPAMSGNYFTAPKVMPRTSCFWLNQPMIRIGAMASVEAADNFAQNKPSGLE